MPESQVAPIVFFSGEDKSSSELGGAMPRVVNAIPDATKTMRRRPGISAWDVFPAGGASGSPVIGMVAFKGRLVYVTEDRRLHALTGGGTILELSDPSDSTTLLNGGGRPCLLSTKDMCVVCGKGAIQKWTGTGLSARLTNTGTGGPPPRAAFMAGIARRLVVQVDDDSGEIWWSGLDDFENWDFSTGEASAIVAAAKPDKLVSLYDSTNEVFAFGTDTVQVFVPSQLELQPDVYGIPELLDFAPVRATNFGTSSPYGVLPVDDLFALIANPGRRIIMSDCRTMTDISYPVMQVLRDFSRVDDAWSFRLRFGRFDSLIWMFPSDGIGLGFDMKTGNWFEWHGWGTGGPKDVQITSAYYWADANELLVGMADGSIAKLDDTAATDLGDPIEVRLTSGFTSHGTMMQKLCKAVFLTFRRTQTVTSESGHVRVAMRDDQGSWEIVKDVELAEELSPTLVLRSMGVYRTRQWKIEYTGSDDLELVDVQEEFEILGA